MKYIININSKKVNIPTDKRLNPREAFVGSLWPHGSILPHGEWSCRNGVRYLFLTGNDPDGS